MCNPWGEGGRAPLPVQPQPHPYPGPPRAMLRAHPPAHVLHGFPVHLATPTCSQHTRMSHSTGAQIHAVPHAPSQHAITGTYLPALTDTGPPLPRHTGNIAEAQPPSLGHLLRLPVGRQHGGQPGGFLRDPSRRSHTILERYRKRTQIYKGTNEPEQQRPGEKAPLTNLPPQDVRGREQTPCTAGCPLSPRPPLTPQKTSSPAETAASGTAASGTCEPTCATTVPAARAPAPRPRPPPTRSPRRRTPTSASAPSPSAARAAPAPAPWRSTCAATAVRPPPGPRPRAAGCPCPPKQRASAASGPGGLPCHRDARVLVLPHLTVPPRHTARLCSSERPAQGRALATVVGDGAEEAGFKQTPPCHRSLASWAPGAHPSLSPVFQENAPLYV